MDKYQHTCNCNEFITKEDIEKCCEYSYEACDNPEQNGCPFGCVHTELGMCEPETQQRTGPAADCGTDNFPESGCYQWDEDDKTCVLMGKQFDERICKWSSCSQCFEDNTNQGIMDNNDKNNNQQNASKKKSPPLVMIGVLSLVGVGLFLYFLKKKT